MQDSLKALPPLKDTVVIYDVPPEILKFYQETLESTNSQLSLWFNPYAIMVATLGILFTVATVIAAIILYRQSKEYQNRYNQLFGDSQKSIKDLANKLATASEQVLNNIIEKEEELNQKLENLGQEISTSSELQRNSSNEEKLQELEKELKSLRNKTENFKNDYGIQEPIYYVPSLLNQGSNIHKHTCSNCGTEFKFKSKKNGIEGLISGGNGLRCPECGHIDEKPYIP